MKRAVFLDRDDTLIVNVPYLGDPTQVEIFPEAAEALFTLRKADYQLFGGQATSPALGAG